MPVFRMQQPRPAPPIDVITNHTLGMVHFERALQSRLAAGASTKTAEEWTLSHQLTDPPFSGRFVLGDNVHYLYQLIQHDSFMIRAYLPNGTEAEVAIPHEGYYTEDIDNKVCAFFERVSQALNGEPQRVKMPTG